MMPGKPRSRFAEADPDSPGQRLKRIRDRLGLRYRDVEQASLSIAQKYGNDEFAIALSRLADIENKGTTPTIYRLYTLCAIYRLDYAEALAWFGIDLSQLPADATLAPHERTGVLGFNPGSVGAVQVPLALDPGVDLRKTTHLSRMIQRWGTIPLMLLKGLDPGNRRYGYVGTEDWWMYPLIQPGTFLLIDETRRKPETGAGWATEFERPIYLFEDREGFHCSWCTLDGDTLTLIPHPSGGMAPKVYQHPAEIDVIGQVTGIAMRLDPVRRRRIRS